MQPPEHPEQTHLHKTTERLGTETLGKLLFRLSGPGIVSMVSVSLYNLVDIFWLGRLGYEYVAAMSVLMPASFVAFAVASGTGVGVNALASRRFGERNTEAAHQAAGQTYFLALGMGALLMAVPLLMPRLVMTAFGATADVIEPGVQFLRVIAWGLPFYFAQIMLRNVFNAAGDAVRPMIYTVFGQALNMILDPLLILGIGFPRMGMAGAALANVISSTAAMLMAMLYLHANRTPYRFRFVHFMPRWAVIRDIYRVGLPAMMLEMTEALVWGLFNRVVGGYGSVALAAVGIAGRLSDLAFMPIIGMCQALLPIVGYCLGAKMWKRLWSAVRLAAVVVTAFLLIATAVLEVLTPQIVGAFNQDPELIGLAVPGMRIFLSTLFIVGLSSVFITTFQGLSKGRDALVLSLARQFVFFLPAMFLLSHYMGLTGVWLSLPASDVSGIVVSGLWLWREYRVQKKSGIWEIEAQSSEASPVP